MSLAEDRIKVLKYLAEKDHRSQFVLIEYLLGPYRSNAHAKRVIKSLVNENLIEINKETGIDPDHGTITVGGKKNQPPRTFKSDIPYRGLEARITVQGFSFLNALSIDQLKSPQNITPKKKAIVNKLKSIPNSNTMTVLGKSFNKNSALVIIKFGIFILTLIGVIIAFLTLIQGG